ncbi:biogenesis of outer membrane [Rhodopirellula islandica]|uniref:Biogenesis of outer membrane n=1 Tax=Rhodopirellula islandica TaxID=595434 RepID=A0A0J1B5Z7_RHOIS|nr:RHS repeat-associated core domain-containing protein [Rhodopirellula islandica]KLU02240.1 biogenesis of outer membrane [Rhodopirellula islandica]
MPTTVRLRSTSAVDLTIAATASNLGGNWGGTLSGGVISGGVDDFENGYEYDYLNRLTSIVQQSQSGGHAVDPKLAEFDYNRASQLTDLHRYSATTAGSSDLEVHSRMAYDDAGRLSSLTHGSSAISSGENWGGTSTLPSSLGSSGLLAAYTFQYDADNRLTQFSSYRDGTSTAYGYDVRDQLTSASSTAISGLSQPFGLASAESYDFDAGGNRKSSGGASQSSANTHNQLQSDGTYNYTYDDEGNTLSRTSISTGEVTLYEWDHRNRLESITEKTSSVGSVTQKIEYVYDAFDNRVGKRLDSDGDGDFDRDEAFVWTEGQTVLRAVDSDGEAASETFTLSSRYLYGEMVDQLLADEQYDDGAGPEISTTTAAATSGETYWALNDHLGSVRDLVDNSGEIRQHVAYDSFGNRIVEQDYDASGTAISSSHPDAIDALFGYTGRDWDADADLQNNRARWYDPATGRWLSNDPIGFAAGDANLYRYVGNGPTNAIDPSGLAEDDPRWWGDTYWFQVWGWWGPHRWAINRVTGYHSAENLAIELDRQLRANDRVAGVNGCDTNGNGVIDPLERLDSLDRLNRSKRLSAAESARVKTLAESAIEGNAAMLGGGLVGSVSRRTSHRILAQVDHLDELDNLGTHVASGKPSQRVTAVPHTYVNPGHHVPGTPTYVAGKSVLPTNHVQLFARSVGVRNQQGKILRWAREQRGNQTIYHRFEPHSSGEYHWSGSTCGVDSRGTNRAIALRDVPVREIGRQTPNGGWAIQE